MQALALGVDIDLEGGAVGRGRLVGVDAGVEALGRQLFAKRRGQLELLA